MNKFLVVFFALLFGWAGISQNRKSLQGKVFIGSVAADVDEIGIENLQTAKKTATVTGGYFLIAAKAGDTLVFSGPEIKSQKLVLSQDNLEQKLFNISLDVEGTQLKEVTIDGKPISNESLGLGGKKYTPAERKLKTAKSLSPQTDGKTALTRVGTDAAINALSGRTSEMKKQVEVEKKEAAKTRMTEIYTPSYFTEDLGIPSDYVQGFLFYAVDDANFVKSLDEGTKENRDLQIAKLATAYKKTIPATAK